MRFSTTIIFLTCLCAVFLTGIPPILADTPLPDIGQSGISVLTPAEERRTGETVVRNIRRAGGILEDPLLTDYLNNLGYRLLPFADNPAQQPFQFFLVDDNTINAFALPGGFIGVNNGLFLATESESELASVLAHEISHVTQRHFARSYENASSNQIPVLAAVIAAMILASKGNELGQAALTSVAAGNIQQQINFTRHNEEEADRIGIQMLVKANLDPAAMAKFFDKLDKQSRLLGDNVPDFLRTHPVTTQRITDAQGRAAQLPHPKLEDDRSYQLMKQRLRILTTDNPAELLQHEEADIKTHPLKQATLPQHYGYALLLSRLQKYPQAETEITRLLKLDPHRIAFLLARAENQINNKQLDSALHTYESALKYYPNNSAITYGYVAALLQAQQPKRAKIILEQYLKVPPSNPEFYQYLAQTEAKLNKPAESHEAMAEYYYSLGQYHQALEQINLALKYPKLDFYTLSRLEARSSQIKVDILPGAETESTDRKKYQNLLMH